MKKAVTFLLSAAMLATSLAGCGVSTDNQGETVMSTGGETVAADPNKPYAGETITYACSDTMAAGDELQALVAMVKEKTGINIEFSIIPPADDGEVDKLLVGLQAGDSIDLIYETTAGLKTYYNAGVLTALDEMAAADSYDMEAIFGENLPKYNDGMVYGLPAFNDIWVTFYNKNVFDAKGVEYPDPEGWTWEEYIETAQKLNDPKNNIWGSLMLEYDNYSYMYAIQKGASAYKEDGTANFDDPLFRESVEWFYSLGNDLKIQPDITSMVAKIYPWNAFTSTGKAVDGVYSNPQFGMFVCGGWVASMLTNEDKYPRDWECGIAPMPYPEGQEPSTLAVTGCYAIPSTSKNKEVAFEVLKCIAENQYTLGYGRIPARKDLTDEEISSYVADKLVPTYEANDHMTADMFTSAWFDADRLILPEKIIGAADGTIKQIWIEEARLYGQKQQSIEDTMTHIQERANKAIAEEKNA